MGRGLLGHDQHRHLRARTRDLRVHGARQATTISRKRSLPADAARRQADSFGYVIDALLDRHRQPAAVSAGQLRRARRHGARSRSPGTRDRARRVGRRRLPHRPDGAAARADRARATTCAIERRRRIVESRRRSATASHRRTRRAHARAACVGRRLHRRRRERSPAARSPTATSIEGPRDGQRRRRSSAAAARSAAGVDRQRRTSNSGPTSRWRRARSSRCR